MRELHGTWLISLHFLDRVNLTHCEVIENAFESYFKTDS